MANENTLRQAENTVVVEGLLQEVRLEPKETKDGRGFIGGEIDIYVKEGEVHTFRVFSMKNKKDGSENGIYKGLETVLNEYVSIAKVGADESDKVRVTSGSVGVNDYVGQDGELKTFPQLSTNFINRVQPNDKFEPKAEFDVELVVQSVSEETNREGEETGRVKLKGFVPQFGGQIAPLEFVVAEDGSEYVRDTYEKGQTVRVYGDIVNRVVVTEKSVEGGFGKPKKEVKRDFTREFLINGGSEPYEDDNKKVFNLDAIKKALTEREVYLNGLVEKKKNQPAASTEPAKKEEKKGGFGAKPKINPADLPF